MTAILLALMLAAALAGVLQGMYHVKPVDKMHRQDGVPLSCSNRGYAIDGQRLLTIICQFDLGIRGHRWQKVEHLIWGAFLAAFFSWARTVPSDWLTLVLQFFIAWFCFEPCYNLARYASINSPYGESVNFLDIKVKIPWIKKVTWTEIKKPEADKPIYEVSFTSTAATVSINSNEEWEIEKHKYVRTWIQIHPFHAKSWLMHTVRALTIIGGLVWKGIFVQS